jgi:hypothetical protein
MLSVCGFHEQHIPLIASVSELNPQEIYPVEILEGFNYEQLKNKKKKIRDSFALDAENAD